VVDISVAYDMQRGNPFGCYPKLNFDLADSAIQVDIVDGTALEIIHNKTSIEKPDFALIY
jgi:hypothetical protein